MEKPKVILNKKRDFSDVINATFSFITQEIKVYGKMLLYYAGIPVLAASILGAYFSGTELSTMFLKLETGSDYQLGLDYQLKVIGVNLLNAMVYVLLSGLSYAYLVTYKENGAGGFELQDVWSRFKKGIGTMILFAVIISIIAGVVIAVASLLVVLGTIFGSPALSVVVGIPAALFLLCVFIYFLVTLSPAGMIIYDESPDFSNIFTRCFELIKGSWWQTFGIIFILGIIYSMVSSLFSIPVLVSSILEGIAYSSSPEVVASQSKSFAFVLTALISTLGGNAIYPILAIGCGIQYFNLKEKRENLDLLGRIEEISDSTI